MKPPAIGSSPAVPIGAGWTKSKRDGDGDYLSLKFDDPSFPQPIFANLWADEADGDFKLIWSRSRDNAPTAKAQSGTTERGFLFCRVAFEAAHYLMMQKCRNPELESPLGESPLNCSRNDGIVNAAFMYAALTSCAPPVAFQYHFYLLRPGTPMAQPIRPHGVGVRGSALVRASELFQGPFGRLFRALPPADYGADDTASQKNLTHLALLMTAPMDPPSDGPDPEESGIPAAFTYFGQFIDHDLTFDPASSLQRQNDPDALVDYRTPRFDLDNIYGRGPDDQPYLYADATTFLLGDPMTGGAGGAFDLPRSQNTNPQRAIIGDPRNDENVIVSQFQGLMHRFHNGIAKKNPTWKMDRIQQEVRFHYQWVVLNSFLPMLVDAKVLDTVLPHIAKGSDLVKDPPILNLYKPRNEAFMPLEFSAAAYRYGHSMVRPAYRLNNSIGPLAIFPIPGTPPAPNTGLGGFRKFPADWAIDWNRFIDLSPLPYGTMPTTAIPNPTDPNNKNRLQLAYRIDTSIVGPLGTLPDLVGPGMPNLAERNLIRGWRMRLPNAQSIAKAMGLVPLTDDQIVIGKFTGDSGDIVTSMDKQNPAFAGNCPLWTYVLAETVQTTLSVPTSPTPTKIKTRRLGDVGGRIVAETFVGILASDSQSFVSMDPLWKPDSALTNLGVFGLRELIAFALAN